MMVPLKVSMLATKIATTYLEVSYGYIMPAQKCLTSFAWNDLCLYSVQNGWENAQIQH
jgi:hypothetical protein